jgi:DNA polymerase elongation subunit (family B)
MNNGVPMDKLDVKGLDVKRSSFPKAFQDIMAEVLISILRGETELQLSDKILAFKKRMTEYDIKDVAKNSAVKELTKYMGKKRQPFQVEKGTPAHVKAAIAYNDCLKHFDSPFKYEPMRNGDKVKWVYLKDNPLGLDGLAFSGYNDPPEVLDFISTYIDHNKICERELQGKLQDFFTAVGWGDVVSEQRTAEKFFSF